MLYANVKKQVIAKALGRDRSTLYREIKRNSTKGYNAREAREQSEKRRYTRTGKIARNFGLQMIIITMLLEKYSPEVISHMLKKLFPDDVSMHVSHESIYQWLYKNKDEAGKHRYTHLLFTRRKKRQNRANCYKNRAKDPSKRNIRERPKEADDRSEPGHLEGDLIVSANNDAYLVTLVDRKSAYTWGISCPTKDSHLVGRAVIEALENLPDGILKSITFDNGSEFTEHKMIESALKCRVYFADPYSAYQRGLNEHINGRIRQYIPKKKSFSHLTDESFQAIFDSINNRPRKSLGWKSPAEVFAACICCT
jgi:IS30 family transposase